jgi:chorismate mutase
VIKFFAWKTTVFVRHTYETHIQIMKKGYGNVQGEKEFSDSGKYYVLKKKAVPEVLLKVVEAKRLLESEKAISIQEATDQVGLSRSSFYKYKDDIFPFHDNARGKTITFVLQMDDEPGLLSLVLGIIANYDANILTIHQTIPINGVASLTLSIEIPPNAKNVSELIEEIETKKGIHYLKILARE